MNPHENVAMWERYVQSRDSDALAVRSTFSTLRSQLNADVIEVGVVRYIDYEAERFPTYNLMEAIMHKRHFFRDEREVRAVVFSMAASRDKHVVPFLTTDGHGFLAPIDPTVLIQGVVLGPKASSDTAVRISELCKTHNLPTPLPSRIASAPQF
jgi:hypothetical protein